MSEIFLLVLQFGKPRFMNPKEEEEVLWESRVMMDTVRAENKNHSQRWGGEKVYQVDIEETYYPRVCGFFGFGKYLVFGLFLESSSQSW